VGSFLVVLRQEAMKDIHSCSFIVNIQVKIRNHRRRKLRAGGRRKEEEEEEEEDDDDDDEKQ